MSLSVISTPVVTESGVVKNLFAGFQPVEFTFKREDEPVTSVGLGVDIYIRITIGTDLTSYLSVGDQIYLNSTGSSGYEYDDVGEITAITASTIDCTIEFVENATGGYINYLKNWYLECQLVDPNNNLIKVLPFSLIDDGDNAGNVTIDVSIANDKNIQEFVYNSQLLDESRIVFELQYREVYEGSSNSFTLIDEEIILVYATEQPAHESFINQLDNPKLWKGYPYGVILTHSSQNNDGNATIRVQFDQLDLNQNDLVTGITAATFDADDEGLFFINQNKDYSYNPDAEYIKYKAELQAAAGFFDVNFFDSAFFETA